MGFELQRLATFDVDERSWGEKQNNPFLILLAKSAGESCPQSSTIDVATVERRYRQLDMTWKQGTKESAEMVSFKQFQNWFRSTNLSHTQL